jgi:hypothetical protein
MMDQTQVENRLIQLETAIAQIQPMLVKKSGVDVDFAVNTAKHSTYIMEHNIMNGILGLHDKLNTYIIPKAKAEDDDIS